MIRLLYNRKPVWNCNTMVQVINAAKIESFIIQAFRCKSYYASLGIDSSASPKDIKSAYYKLSLKFHPDKNNSEESIEKFREITEAYEVLGNPEKKKTYDQNFRARAYYNDFGGSDFSQRTRHYYGPPRTGRDQYYNYDEHYRHHYEEYMKQREMENEYFKRRWRADRRARYGDDYYETYDRARRPHPVTLRMLLHSKSFVSFITLWIILIFLGTIVDDGDKPKSKVVYYNVKKDEKND
ncbi:dnaJ subfamily B member 12 [Trichonephila inaurata madagascariensis]|uniref:DnaJ subfamily B member 12 n=1 Tax=Trichonephila inaurata madagascariensis TaxID=2747483 RepID=A0A8X6XL47_9ARAC|nr:dnaJ subfamily B member 12 [Trichonephila inaurata madagascariensis]